MPRKKTVPVCTNCETVDEDAGLEKCPECGKQHCQDCVQTCSSCETRLCPDKEHATRSEGFAMFEETVMLCAECAGSEENQPCCECGERLGGNGGVECGTCGKKACDDCADPRTNGNWRSADTRRCTICGEMICSQCVGELEPCAKCGAYVCKSCVGKKHRCSSKKKCTKKSVEIRPVPIEPAASQFDGKIKPISRIPPIPKRSPESPGNRITRLWLDESMDECAMCGACEMVCPEVFTCPEKMTVHLDVDITCYQPEIQEAAETCPLGVIAYEIENSGVRENKH